MGMEWTSDQTVRLIRSLKRHEILWNSRSKSYRDRKMKANAWTELEREVGLPVDKCKRRVESLMASCRREKNKIAKSAKEDEPPLVYEPKWIYWKALKFLRGDTDEGTSPEDKLNLLSILPQWSPSARRPPRKRRKVKEETSIEENQRIGQSQKQQQNSDEYDAFGITVAAKLRKMEENQRLFAEHIINETLYKGMLSQLTGAEQYHHTRMMPQQQHQQHPTNQWGNTTETVYSIKNNALPVEIAISSHPLHP